jgi:hypothetical protein
MDFVYLCRDGENEELRYSIRSVVSNFNDVVIWVVGGKPDWYCGNFIEVPQDSDKFKNQINNLKAAIYNKTILNNFVLMNDDFFILFPEDSYKYYSGLLEDKITNHMYINGNSSYAITLITAMKLLKKKGISQPLNYDIHTPMTLNKALLAQVIDLSTSFRSVYGNLFIKDGIEIDDVKIYKREKDINFDTNFISTEDNSFDLIKDKLEEMFPNPSIYEIK